MRAFGTLTLAVALCGSSLLVACDPEDPCDPGFFADHGVCLPEKKMPVPAADGGEDDGGGPYGNPNDWFGRPCTSNDDCGGNAVECGAPELPLCTAINCLQGESTCPPDWTCLDISAWERPYEYVYSFCVKF